MIIGLLLSVHHSSILERAEELKAELSISDKYCKQPTEEGKGQGRDPGQDHSAHVKWSRTSRFNGALSKPKAESDLWRHRTFISPTARSFIVIHIYILMTGRNKAEGMLGLLNTWRMNTPSPTLSSLHLSKWLLICIHHCIIIIIFF